MRESRVLARAIPQLHVALAAGEITLYRASEIARLSPQQQEIAVAQWVNRSLLRTEGQAIATEVIRGFLHDSADKENSISLAVLSATIRDAIRDVANPRCGTSRN
jgi:hypothetical protein